MKRTLPMVESCDGCGACCTGQAALPVHLAGHTAGAFLVVALPDALRLELLATVDRFNRDGWPADDSACIWYDAATQRCRHYEYRPNVCRDLAVGSDGCHRWRRALGIEPRPV